MRQQTVVVVENDKNRIDAMNAEINEHFPDAQLHFFTNAPSAIVWLEKNWAKVNLVSLDFDLGTDAELADPNFDVGTGGDVADWLAAREQFCPVILHTDSFFTRPTMQKALDAGNWKHEFVTPGNGTTWVVRLWLPIVQKHLSEGVWNDH